MEEKEITPETPLSVVIDFYSSATENLFRGYCEKKGWEFDRITFDQAREIKLTPEWKAIRIAEQKAIEQSTATDWYSISIRKLRILFKQNHL